MNYVEWDIVISVEGDLGVYCMDFRDPLETICRICNNNDVLKEIPLML